MWGVLFYCAASQSDNHKPRAIATGCFVVKNRCVELRAVKLAISWPEQVRAKIAPGGIRMVSY